MSQSVQRGLQAFLSSTLLLLAACGSGGGSSDATAASSSAASSSTAASSSSAIPTRVSITVDVPSTLSAPPFNEARQLQVPSGFGIRVIARVDDARFLATTPDGGILVSVPNSGKLVLLKNNGTRYEASDFASGLSSPHDMVLYQEGNNQWLYVSETARVIRYAWTAGMTRAGTAQVVVADLPSAATPGITSYSHRLKNITIGPDGKLYVAIASSCNVCESDATADPVRGAIYVYDADGKNGRLFARGLRNAEGLAFLPGTSQLWAAVNNRDNMPYPYHRDFDGNGSDDYSKVMTAFVDDNPPEPFTAVRDGGDYGWPYCNASPRNGTAIFNLPLERDLDTNADGSKRDCSKLDSASVSLPAHTAPLGMSFLHNSGMPAPWKQGAAIALHGCWNCSRLNGHSVVFVPVDSSGKPGNETDLITGWIIDAAARTRWGRPVDVIAAPSGGLLVSDDYSGTVYELYAK
jgi:glucose/arabinose dehydrogenase